MMVSTDWYVVVSHDDGGTTVQRVNVALEDGEDTNRAQLVAMKFEKQVLTTVLDSVVAVIPAESEYWIDPDELAGETVLLT